MRAASGSTGREYGGAATDRTILLASDTHPENVSDGFRNELRYNVMRKDWEAIADEYGCDELWLGGDLGTMKDFKACISYNFETVKAAVGDEDRKVELDEDDEPGWYAEEIEKHGSLDQMNKTYGIETGEVVGTQIPATTRC